MDAKAIFFISSLFLAFCGIVSFFVYFVTVDEDFALYGTVMMAPFVVYQVYNFLPNI